jgi:hypothetical protein
MKGKDICSTCGAPAEGLAEKMEVEYKVFKRSELLEIGRKRDEDTKKAVTTAVRTKSATREASAEFTDLLGKKKLLVIIAGLLLAAVIGCALYFWRFLFSR